jgi:hypothetical protein
VQQVRCPFRRDRRPHAEDNLARHVADKHAPQAQAANNARAKAAAAEVERVVDLIIDKLADGTLKPGHVVNQGELATQLGGYSALYPARP